MDKVSQFGAALEQHSGRLAIALVVLFLLQAFGGAQLKSLGGDEPGFIGGGYAAVKWRDYAYYNYIPPLMPGLAALPLLHLDIRNPDGSRPQLSRGEGYLLSGRRLMLLSGEDIWRTTMLSRLPSTLLGAMLVGIVFLFIRGLVGPLPALGVTLITAFSPTLLGHAKLATADVGAASLMVAAVATFWWARRGEALLAADQPAQVWARWALCGVLTGLALLAKLTALLLGPIFVAYVLVEWWLGRVPGAGPVAALPVGTRRQQIMHLLFAAMVAWLIVGAAYHGSFDYSHYVTAIQRLYVDHHPDYHWFALGEFSKDTWWWYYFAMLGLKVPIATLVLVICGLGLIVLRPRANEALLYCMIPVAVIFGISMFDDANVGIRRIIPAFPFLLALAVPCFRLGRKALAGAAAGLGLLAAVESVASYPHHLAFFNVAAGGPGGGFELADESNVDWDLDFPALAQWQEQHAHGIPLKLFTRGFSVPGAYGVIGAPGTDNDLLLARPGIYVISAHVLMRLRLFEQQTGKPFDWLARRAPDERVGASLYIFDLSGRERR